MGQQIRAIAANLIKSLGDHGYGIVQDDGQEPNKVTSDWVSAALGEVGEFVTSEDFIENLKSNGFTGRS